MSSELTEFFSQERQRYFTPTSGFCERFMFGLQKQPTPRQTFCDALFAASGPVLGTALAGSLILIGIVMTLPVVPNRGPTDVYAEAEFPSPQQAIYMDVDIPSTPVVFEELISEDEQ
jgi:hypothetical protein